MWLLGIEAIGLNITVDIAVDINGDKTCSRSEDIG